MKIDIAIIGGGAAGIGFATCLKHHGLSNYVVLEKGEIGQNFRNWPLETRFITPSFTSNGFGIPDLNAISPDTSPAYTFNKERISGKEFAQYLKLVVQAYDLPIITNTKVTSISKNNDYYCIQTDKGLLEAKYIIMAVGEFSNPSLSTIKGAILGIHYSKINSFNDFEGNEFSIIGGNESGIDAAINLSRPDRNITVYTESSGLFAQEADPSIRLSPFTMQRFQEALNANHPITIVENHHLKEINYSNNNYQLLFENSSISSPSQPILATGFLSEIFNFAPDLFEISPDGTPKVNMFDESTINQNVFLVGPSLRQPGMIFCYIYKFRQRFSVIIQTIAARENWQLDEDIIAFYRKNQMHLEDLSCCQVECDC